MNAGKLRHRITIQQQQESTKDSYGALVESWLDVAASIWASVEPLSGREFYAAQQVNSETTTRITIRYRSGVISKMRAVYGERIYDILSVIDPEERHIEMQLMCKELTPNDNG